MSAFALRTAVQRPARDGAAASAKRIASLQQSQPAKQAGTMSIRRLTKAILLANALLPALLGFALYTLWRSKTLLIFRFYQAVGLYQPVLALRSHVAALKHLLPSLLLYSVPDALWVYSATAVLTWVWYRDPRRATRLFWMLLPVALAVASEFAQLFKLIQGTFDWMDVSCYLLAWALATASVYVLMSRAAKANSVQNSVKE